MNSRAPANLRPDVEAAVSTFAAMHVQAYPGLLR